MAKIIQKTQTMTTVEADGSEHTTVIESCQKLDITKEPDYIKVYTNMWCEFNAIPEVARNLFFELACRMTYCNLSTIKDGNNTGSQIVYTLMLQDVLIEKLNIKKRQYQRLLKILVDCGAIRRVKNGVYQINPKYCSKGEWKYNPKMERGGVENLVAKFDFRKHNIELNVVWTDPEILDDLAHKRAVMFEEIKSSGITYDDPKALYDDSDKAN